jgi:hypothetical protein
VLGIDGPAAPERLELVGRGAPLTPAPEIAALLGGGSAPPDVREARASYERAREAQQLWQTAIAPQAQAVLERTRAAYASGQESYRIVLEATRQRLELAACEAQVVAEARRAAAELELRVGRRAFGAD